jgi:class 3 adenylate cyclase
LSQVAAEIAHVLFLDIVDFSRESTPVQAKQSEDLTRLVASTKAYEEAKRQNSLLTLPTGDGMALLFFTDVSAPARCAREISEAVRGGVQIRLRMGIHSGLVQRQRDISGNENVVGEGINTAQRVMNLADDGHILTSAQYADWLKQFDEWSKHLQPLGETEVKHGLRVGVYNLVDGTFGNNSRPARVSVADLPRAIKPLKISILYRRDVQPDSVLLSVLERELSAQGHKIFIDRHLKVGVDWAKAIEKQVRSSDAVIAILSDQATRSEMLEYELEIAQDENGKRSKPQILPVRVGSDEPLQGPVGVILNPLNFSVWHGPQDDRRVLTELISALAEPIKPKVSDRQLESVGGAVPPDSPFYIEREADAEFLEAIRCTESIVLVKGPRQMGKTSLLGRGVRQVRDLGWRCATTDFQKLSSSQMQSEDTFYKLLAATLARQLKFQYDFENEWMDVFGANMNMDNFIRSLLEDSDDPLVWFMDEADKLFGAPFASDFFGLVRSWHNSRATEPFGPWGRFTVVIAYATEAHLFIKDLNQSPFNVGRQLELQSFNVPQMSDLNKRYGSPIGSEEDVAQLHALIAGQPFLTRRALDLLARGAMTFEQLMAASEREDGPFGDHLKRILVSVSQMPEVIDVLRSALSQAGARVSDTDSFHRLQSAGIARQSSQGHVEIVNELYRRYLVSHLC